MLKGILLNVYLLLINAHVCIFINVGLFKKKQGLYNLMLNMCPPLLSTCHSPRGFGNSCVLDISSKRKNVLWAISNWFQWIISLFYLPGLLILFSPFPLSYCHVLFFFSPKFCSLANPPASTHGEKPEKLCSFFL